MSWLRRRILRWLEGENQKEAGVNMAIPYASVSHDADFRVAIHKAENGTIIEFLQSSAINYSQGNLSIGVQPKSASSKRYIVVAEGESVADAIVTALVRSKLQ